MTTMPASDTTAIRDAIASGDFERARALWDSYAASIRHEIRRSVCTEERLQEAAELLEWSRRQILCQRAHAQDRLNEIHAAERYCPGPAGPPASWITRG